jgi:parallel beta-helix repeat protein
MNQKTLFRFALVAFLLLGILLICISSPAICQDAVTRTTILIQSDGSIYPAYVPIQVDGSTYTLTQDIYDPILIEKSGIVFDGGGHSLIGPLNETQRKAEQVIGIGPTNETQVPYIIGIDVNDGVSNVTIKNLKVHNFSIGAYIHSTGNTLQENFVYDNIVGVLLSGSANTIYKNYIANNEQGLFFGFEPVDDVGNIPSDVKISHNSFDENTWQLSGCVCKEYNLDEERHCWDDGKEGNYWSDYKGTDENGDGIGDEPYVVDILNQDRYPLMQMPISLYPIQQPLSIDMVILIVSVPLIAVAVLLIFREIKKANRI